ncbi:MAG: hypothetical protein JST26_19475 [Bacteroidetes bacterium]|nr:hypothetical protein [Bacteroidota bacterium]
MMTALENLHYAIGQIAYAIAHADGRIQPEERKKFHDMVAAELRCKDYDFDVSDIIFQILDKDKPDSQTAYDWAMAELKLNGHYLSPELKRTFIHVIEKIAKAYPPVTVHEAKLIERFKADINHIHGDPVYYEQLKQHKH